MRIGHINLARGFRGGERQTQLLIEALATSPEIDQCLIGRRGEALLQRMSTLNAENKRGVTRPYMFSLGGARDRQLLHAHEGKAGHFAMMANVRYGVPYIITRRVVNRPKENKFTRMVYGRASRIVAISNAVRESMLDYDESLTVDVIPSMRANLAVDEREVSRLKQQYQDKFVIGHAGALDMDVKGQQYIIEAARRLQKSHPQIHFVLLGEGKDGARLRELASGLSNIDFIGFVDNVGDYISIFDMFVFPSLEEGLGSILLDVMSFNKPIIASEVDGIPDIVHHDKTGLLIPCRDSDAMYSQIVNLYQDDVRRNRLASAGFELVDSYRPDALAVNYLELYRELLK
jgi:glycosyltransferase involved in cell wall biosynthesis